MLCNWIITPDHAGFQILNGKSRIGTITSVGDRWEVHFMHKPALDFSWASDSADVAIGYVRGIERAAQLSQSLAFD